jgi:hypothetical protein
VKKDKGAAWEPIDDNNSIELYRLQRGGGAKGGVVETRGGRYPNILVSSRSKNKKGM